MRSDKMKPRQGQRDSPRVKRRDQRDHPLNRRQYRERDAVSSDTRNGRGNIRRGGTNPDRHYRSPHRSPIYSPQPPASSVSRPRDGRYSNREKQYDTLLVRNFSSEVRREDIKESLSYEFRKFGECTIRVTRDYQGDRVAYASFRSYKAAQDCKNARGHLVMHDRRLIIEAVLNNEQTAGDRPKPPVVVDRSPPPVRGGGKPAAKYRSANRRMSPSGGDQWARGDRGLSPPRQEKSMSRDRSSYSRYSPPPPARGRGSSKEYSPIPRKPSRRSVSSPASQPSDNNYPPTRTPSPSQQSSDYDSDRDKKPRRSADRSFSDATGGDKFPSSQMESLPPPPPAPPMFVPVGMMDKPIPPEDDPMATRTLFVGNLENNINNSDIRRAFEVFGKIDDIDVKRSFPNRGSAYCFVRFSNLDDAYRAKITLNGKPIVKNIVRIGYGKVMLSSKVWVGGLGPWTRLSDLEREFDRFGSIRHIDYRKGERSAAILYETIDAAQAACAQMRGFLMPNAETRLRMDLLDPEPGLPGFDKFADRMQSKPHNFHDNYYHHQHRDNQHYDNQQQDHRGGDKGGEKPYRGRNVFDRKRRRDSRSPLPHRQRHHSGSDRRRSSTRGGKSSPDRHHDRNRSAPRQAPPASQQPPALPDTAMTEMQFKHFHAKSCYSLHDLCACFDPPCWQGGFVLKKIAFPVLFFLLDGDMGVFNTTTADPNSPTGRQTSFHFTHRLKLTDERQTEIRRRMKNCERRTCLIVAVPGVPENLAVVGTQSGPVPTQHKPLRGLVKYFKEKEAAGVISVPVITLDTPAVPPKPEDGGEGESKSVGVKDKQQVSGVLHAFPPGPFATEQLLKVGPSLQPQFFADDYLVVLLVKGPPALV